MIYKDISDYIFSFKNKIMEADDIVNSCAIKFEEFSKSLKEQKLDKEYKENFLTILGYSYRLDKEEQRLFFTFQEAVYAIDLDRLMRDEESMKLNSIVYALVLDTLIKEYVNQDIDEQLKQKAIETYKKIEQRKAKEANKYHKYQY